MSAAAVAAPPQPPASTEDAHPTFVFTPDNFKAPKLPHNLEIIDVPLVMATDENLEGYGYVIHSADERTVEKKNFEIVPWPRDGPGQWRKLDPLTGDEAGTTEGPFRVHWQGDYFCGENLAINTSNNQYLDGLAALPEVASHNENQKVGDGKSILLWMSDYHPGQSVNFFFFFFIFNCCTYICTF